MPLPWPLPALLAWGASWLLFTGLQPRLGAVWALVAACALATLASVWARHWWRRVFIALGFPLALAVSGAGALPPWAWLIALALLLLVYPLNAWRDAPLFPTPPRALDGLTDAAPLAADSRVLDAGCGLGHGLRALRRAYPRAALFGIEGSWPLALWCRLRCPWASVRRADIWGSDWSDYQLVYLFQRPESMERAAAKASAEMVAGSWFVSLGFPVPSAEPAMVLPPTGGHPVWLYRTPIAQERPVSKR